MKVTFIGLGIMGSRMAKNLLKNGIDITVANRSETPLKELEAAGAKTASSFVEAVHDADIVFTMLAKPDVVSEVMHHQCLSAMKAGSLWVDCSTVNPSFARESAKAAEEAGVRFLDSPVAGTLPHAENAELIFLVGGNKETIEEVEHLMNFMGHKVMHLGDQGMGSSFKMLVNGLLAQTMVIFSEALLLGEKMGLDKDFLLSVLPSLPVVAPVTKDKAEMIRSGDYTPNFPLELMHKDLHLAAVTAYENNQPMHIINAAKEVYAEAVKAGMGREDFGAIYKYLDR